MQKTTRNVVAHNYGGCFPEAFNIHADLVTFNLNSANTEKQTFSITNGYSIFETNISKSIIKMIVSST